MPDAAQRGDEGFAALAVAGGRCRAPPRSRPALPARRNDGPTTLPATASPLKARAVRAAQRHLVPLLAVLIHAQNADVAAVVVAAGVDAAADVQVDLAQVVQLVHVLVALGDGCAAIGIERALASAQKSPPGQAIMSVSRRMLERAKPAWLAATPQRGQVFGAHPGQQQVLVVRDARFAGARTGRPGRRRCPAGRQSASPGAWPRRLNDRVTARSSGFLCAATFCCSQRS